MIVRRFLAWAQTAPAGARAEGASALARAYLYSDLDDADQREAEVVLTALLDDASPLVRRALAEAFASAVDAPHHCIVTLANDQSDIASLVLSRSPVLADSELIDCAAVGDAFAQAAIAVRPNLSAPVAAALTEVGAREALISLAVNETADLREFSMRRMLERFGDDGELREALLSRAELPASLRSDLVAATARALGGFATRCGWMSEARTARVTREALEKACVIIAADSSGGFAQGPLALVRRLRATGQLTPGLMLRALLSGDRGLFDAALSDLSGVPGDRAAGLVNGGRGLGFQALYARAGLPKALLPAFTAALGAQEELGAGGLDGAAPRLSRPLIERVLSACERLDSAELGKLMALLRRLEAEAAGDDARDYALAMGPDAARDARDESSQAAPALISVPVFENAA